MFNVKIKSETLREIVDVISTLVEEVKFNVKKDGISVKAVDPAHVAMVDLYVRKDAFEEYSVDECELGIDIDKIKELLKLAKFDDIISLKHDESKNKLVMRVGNITRWTPLVDTVGMSEAKVPVLTLPTKVTIRTEELRQGIRAAESIADHLSLGVSPEGLEITSKGDSDEVFLNVDKDHLESLSCKEPVRSLYPLDYFSNVVKAVTTAPTVTLSVGTDYPVKFEFVIAGGKGEVRYLLAPRVESE